VLPRLWLEAINRRPFHGVQWGLATPPSLLLTHPSHPITLHLHRLPQAGGRGSDGKTRILGVQPSKLHQRLPLFMGSPEDIAELEGYKDVQQGAKKYEV